MIQAFQPAKGQLISKCPFGVKSKKVHVNVPFFDSTSFLEARAEILWYFGRNDDTKRTFRNYLTCRIGLYPRTLDKYLLSKFRKSAQRGLLKTFISNSSRQFVYSLYCKRIKNIANISKRTKTLY